jgi:fructose-bisphosphate aldolase class II
MPLVTSKEVLNQAMMGHYAVGAFNANNMEMVQAIVEAAQEERAPVILQVSQGAISYAGLDYAARSPPPWPTSPLSSTSITAPILTRTCAV